MTVKEKYVKEIKEKLVMMKWKCERCGKLIPYMAVFCNDCANELLGEAPKPFKPPIENNEKGMIKHEYYRIC